VLVVKSAIPAPILKQRISEKIKRSIKALLTAGVVIWRNESQHPPKSRRQN
jgi:hypothetical protein